jgi:hypothetical protein
MAREVGAGLPVILLPPPDFFGERIEHRRPGIDMPPAGPIEPSGHWDALADASTPGAAPGPP